MGTTVDTFGVRLRHALTAQGLGVRTLAKRMTSHDPARLEVVRRRLNKYVNEGVTPTASARYEIEDALGVDRDSLLADDDDDDEDSLQVALLRVIEALRVEIRAEIRAEDAA